MILPLLLIFGAATAQNGAAAVFLDRGAATALVFVDLNGGEQHRVEIGGEQFTPLADSVMFFDTRNRSVKLVGADGRSRLHPFITLDAAETRVNWAVSDDGKHIAWTTIAGNAPGAVSTTTRVADIDGDRLRTVFQETRDDGLRAKPVAFSIDASTLYLDYQPDGLDALTVFPQYAGLFSLDLTADDPAGSFAFLSGEPGDFTGAGFGGGYFLRLGVSDQPGGFDIHVMQFGSAADWDIPATRGGGAIAGGVLVAPDGRYAVYAQSALQGVGAGTSQAETVVMLVDLTEMTQSALTGVQEGVLRPVAWSEEDTAVILVNPARAGTWKVRLSDGRVQQIAELTYIGQISGF